MSFADRAWLAFHALPRVRGRSPSYASVERSVTPALANGTLNKIFSEERYRDVPKVALAERIARALQCDFDWLTLRAETPVPTPSGPVPSRHSTFGLPIEETAAVHATPANPFEAAAETLADKISAEVIAAVRAEAAGHEHERPALHWGRILVDREEARRAARSTSEAPIPKTKRKAS